MDSNLIQKVRSDMELADTAKVDFRRTIDQLNKRASSFLMLTVQWKDIEDLMHSSRESLEQRAKELEVIEESLRGRMDELNEKEERLVAVETREKQLKAIHDSVAEKLNELEREQKEFGLRQRSEVEKRKEEIERVEKSLMQLESVEQSVNNKLQDLSSRLKEFESIKKLADDRLVELRATEQFVQKQRQELESDLNQLKECAKEFETRKRLFRDGTRGVEQRMKDLEAAYDNKNKGLEIAGQGNAPTVQKDFWEKKLFDAITGLKYMEEKKLESLFPMQEFRANISAIEKQLACWQENAVSQTQMGKPVISPKERCHGSSNSKKGSGNDEVSVALPSTTTLTRAPAHEMSIDQQRCVKRQRTSEPTGAAKCVHDTYSYTSVQDSSEIPTGNGPIPEPETIGRSSENLYLEDKLPSPSPCQSNNHLDGETKTPQMLPSGKKNNSYLKESQLLDAFRCASDPAKFLLDTVMALEASNVEGVYAFKLTVSTNICFCLLNELRKLPYKINSLVKDEAKKLAMAWNSKLLKKRLDQMEVPCFLQFLVVYDLASLFRAEELLNLLNNVYWRTRAPDLCKSLGLVDEIPNFIQNLIKKGQLPKAIEHIYALDMVDKFAPVPLLNEFLKRVNDSAENSSEKTQNAAAAQVAAINKRIQKLRDAHKCIKRHNLQSDFPLDTLEQRIYTLYKQRSELNIPKLGKDIDPTPGAASSLPKDLTNKANPGSVSTSPNTSVASASKPATPTSKSSVSETPRARNSPTIVQGGRKKRGREDHYHRRYSPTRMQGGREKHCREDQYHRSYSPTRMLGGREKRCREDQYGIRYSQSGVASNRSKYFSDNLLPRHPIDWTYRHELDHDEHYSHVSGNPRMDYSDDYWNEPLQGYDSHQNLYRLPFRKDYL